MGDPGDNGVSVDVIGRPRCRDTLDHEVAEAAVDAWIHEHVDSSFGVVGDFVILRVGRGDTGLKLEDGGRVPQRSRMGMAARTGASRWRHNERADLGSLCAPQYLIKK